MKLSSSVILLCVLSGMFAGCSTAPKTAGDAAALSAETDAALVTFKAADSSLQGLLDKSVGYAVFPNIGKAGWIIGGSYGRGEVFEGGQRIGYADVSEASAGLQWGAQNFSQLLVFLTQEKLEKFKSSDFALSGNVSAVALTAGAAGTTDLSKGAVAFVRAKGGLMAEAAVGGQRLRFVPSAPAAPAATHVK